MNAFVLQLLYWLDTHPGSSIPEAVRYFQQHLQHEEEMPISSSLQEIADTTAHVVAIWNSRPELDRYLQKSSPEWRVERMTLVDRNILRMAVQSLLSKNMASFEQILEDAMILAAQYSTQESPAFIKGVLERTRTLLPTRSHGPSAL